LRSYKGHTDRIIPFFRLNPRYAEWKDELKERVQQGFRGIKLHPRSQKFRINSAAIKEIIKKAEEHDLFLLIHTGFGVRYLEKDVAAVVKEFPKVRFILGHAAFPSINEVMKSVGGKSNVVFETSSLRIFDLYDLIKNVSYKNIVFGSDMPYYDQTLSLEALIDTAALLKKTPNQIKEMLGGNMVRWLK
jgi:hypothetical protein